jgi:penicillin amidase
MNDLIDGLDKDQPVAMSWISHSNQQILDAAYQLSHAKNKGDFQRGGSNCCSVSNVMYGDAKGNVACGRQENYTNMRLNTNFILDGASGRMILKNI